jgi:hypothetical protein
MAFEKDQDAAFDVGRYDNNELRRETSYAAATSTGLSVNTALNTRTESTLIAGGSATGVNYYVDGSDSLANRGLTINLVHVPTQKAVRFKAFLMAFNESYSSDWSSESVYGRADPIHMFKQTSRNISLAWKIVAATEGEAVENLVRLQKFLQMLYPTYLKPDAAQTINQSPLIRLQMSNMIRKSAEPKDLTGLREEDSPAVLDTGLLGIIKNVSIAHNLENTDIGVFELGATQNHTPNGDRYSSTTNNIVPKAIEVQMDFSVVHEHMLGWTKTGTTWTFGGGDEADATGFPYYVKDGSEVTAEVKAENARQAAAWKGAITGSNEGRTSYATTVNELAQYSETIGAAFQAAGVDATTVEGTAQVAQYAGDDGRSAPGSTAESYQANIESILELTQ